MEVSELRHEGTSKKHPSLGFSMKPAIKGYPQAPGDSFLWPGEIKVISQAGKTRRGDGESILGVEQIGKMDGKIIKGFWSC